MHRWRQSGCERNVAIFDRAHCILWIQKMSERERERERSELIARAR